MAQPRNSLKEAVLSLLVKALSSSVGKKFVMGFTGLLLCGFLVAHLAGNLLLYVGPDAYNKYAHALHSEPALLFVVEIHPVRPVRDSHPAGLHG